MVRCSTVSRRLLVGGTALLGLVVGGCTGDPGPAAAPDPTALGPASATTAPGTTQYSKDQQEVVDAYLFAVGVVRSAQMSGRDPGADHEMSYKQPLLGVIQDTLKQERNAGHAAPGQPLLRERWSQSSRSPSTDREQP